MSKEMDLVPAFSTCSSPLLVKDIWEWPMPIKRPEKLMLLALARNTREEDQNYFSVAELAVRTGYSERRARRILRTLEQDGHITIKISLAEWGCMKLVSVKESIS